MNWMMKVNSFFVMVILLTIIGSIVGTVFLLTQRLIYRHTSANFMMFINKIIILCFVIPVFTFWGIVDGTNQILIDNKMVVLIQSDTVKSSLYGVSNIIHFANTLSVLWFTGVLIYLLLQLVAYLYLVCIIKTNCRIIENAEWNKNFFSICAKKELNFKRIKLLSCNNVYQPCVMGIKNSIILIPEHLIQKLTEEEIDIVVSHELTHIQKRDVPLKIIILVLCSLNWFNPILHLVKKALYDWMEIGCDEDLTVYAEQKHRKAYIDVLIKLNEEQIKEREFKTKAVSYFYESKNFNILKRRITGIMKRNTKGNSIFKGVVITCLVCLMTGSIAFAKELEMPMNTVFSNHIQLFQKDEYMFEAEEDFLQHEENSFVDTNPEISGIEIDTAIYFISNSGEGYVIDSAYLINSQPIETKHSHNWQNGGIKEHKKNKDGSCRMLIYEGKRCSVCEYAVVGELISETTYKKCTH